MFSIEQCHDANGQYSSACQKPVASGTVVPLATCCIFPVSHFTCVVKPPVGPPWCLTPCCLLYGRPLLLFFQQSPHNVPNSHETSNVGNALNSQAIKDFFGVPFPRWLNHLVAHEPTCIFSTHPNFCLGPLFFKNWPSRQPTAAKRVFLALHLADRPPKVK